MKSRIFVQNNPFCLISLMLASVLVYSISEWRQDASAQTGDALARMELYWLGQKFTNESMEQRLHRLEQVAGKPGVSKAPIELRKARLLSLSQGEAEQEAKHRAIQAYNRGVEEANQGNLKDAITYYRQALQVNPRMSQAYNNLAYLYDQQHRFDEAIALYQQALRFSPQDASLHRNLGVLYEKTGNTQAALKAYQQYLNLTPHQPDIAIASVVKDFKAQSRHAREEPDYLSVVTQSSQGQRLIWPESMNPVPIYIHLSDADQVRFLPAVHQALAQWEQALPGRLKFKEVSRAEKARIRLTLHPGPLAHPSRDVGHAQFYAQSMNTIQYDDLVVTIGINTGESGSASVTADNLPIRNKNVDHSNGPGSSVAYRSAQVQRLVLHEIGHAIGIWGHSSNPEDIMFTHPIVSTLSPRDSTTIRKLYRLE